MNPPKVLKSERRFEGKVFNLIVDEIEYPSGTRAIREIAEHPGGAVVIALNEKSEILLIRQFRYPMKEMLYELPAGKLSPNEDPQHCAARELEEETGYIAASLRKITAIYTSPGFCTERLHLYLAERLSMSSRGPRLEEGEEGLTCEWFPFRKVVDMIHKGEIMDAKTICAVLMAKPLISAD